MDVAKAQRFVQVTSPTIDKRPVRELQVAERDECLRASTTSEADSVEEAIEALSEHGDDARVLAGGQSLVAMLNMRLVAPEVIVDISRVPELATITRTEDSIAIGAAVTQAATERFDGLEAHLPLLARALPFVGHYQTRARGTVCGSIAHADPSSELPLCLAALGGEVVLRSVRARVPRRWPPRTSSATCSPPRASRTR